MFITSLGEISLPMSSKDNSDWEEFSKAHLLKQGILDGVALLSLHGIGIYTYGLMDSVEQSNWGQFSKLFHYSCGPQEQDLVNQGFKLVLANGRIVSYKIYNKSFCSAYCTSEGGEDGLIVSRLPCGILVCSYAVVPFTIMWGVIALPPACTHPMTVTVSLSPLVR
ncbi:uncharacterized protein LOC135484042 [Lineus longissimus]|uniref:uncharacterized protein LOC135484042 n=1 Tax=Lineus longissimus TaxID=88925 RepID=UPI00315D8B05